MSDKTDRVADRLARLLHQAGVRVAFGMPGGEVITFVDALGKAGIEFVLARNETAAAMMAAGSAVEGDAPGLLVTTLGPGLANAVNGIADAWQERAPLLVVSGVVEAHLRGGYTHQIVDHRALLSPLVKASFDIDPRSAEPVLARALRLATTPPFGPVHIDLSPAIAAEPAHGASALSIAPVVRPAPDARDAGFEALRARLRASKRPVILAGHEAVRGSSAGVLSDLALRHGIPVLTTYKAKGLIDETHPLSLGAAGLSPLADRILLGLVRRADLVLLAGYDPIEMRTGWMDFATSATLVDIGPATDHAMHDAGLRIEGDVGACFAALFEGVEPTPRWRDGEPQACRLELARAFAPPGGFGPHEVFATLQESLPADATVTVDSGAHRILFSQMWQARRPNRVLQSAGWCTMGSAIPLAIGAAMAHPGRRVVAVLGDGGLEMTMGELGLLRDQELPVTLVVLQDQCLELIGLKQDQSQLRRSGVALGATNYVMVAEAFGGRGFEARSAADMREALAVAATSKTFTLIACQIEARAYVDRI